MTPKIKYFLLLSFWLLDFCVSTTAVAKPVSTKSSHSKKMHLLKKKILQLDTKFQELQRKAQKREFPSFDVASIAEGRLTTESGIALSTSDRSAQSTLYFTPYYGSAVALYDGAIWELFSFSEISLALTGLTSDKNYDVFLYSNGGTLTLELSAAWASDTARTDAITTQNGIYVKSGATTRRLLGTLRTTSTTTTEDSKSKRFVWNYLNRRERRLHVIDSTNSWSYNSTSWRAANNSSANKVEYVVGLDDRIVVARTLTIATASAGSLNYAASGVGIDSATVNSAQLRGSGTSDATKTQIWGEYVGYPGLGYHYVQWLEASHATGITFYGDNGDGTKYQSGMIVEVTN